MIVNGHHECHKINVTGHHQCHKMNVNGAVVIIKRGHLENLVGTTIGARRVAFKSALCHCERESHFT